MVKFGKNKFKAINKIAKKQKQRSNNITNKVLKKKLNAAKKVSFQKEVLINETAAGDSPLVTSVSARKVLLDKLSTKLVKKKIPSTEKEVETTKVRSVEKRKKRQKTQMSDTKLLLNLMKSK